MNSAYPETAQQGRTQERQRETVAVDPFDPKTGPGCGGIGDRLCGVLQASDSMLNFVENALARIRGPVPAEDRPDPPLSSDIESALCLLESRSNELLEKLSELTNKL